MVERVMSRRGFLKRVGVSSAAVLGSAAAVASNTENAHAQSATGGLLEVRDCSNEFNEPAWKGLLGGAAVGLAGGAAVGYLTNDGGESDEERLSRFAITGVVGGAIVGGLAGALIGSLRMASCKVQNSITNFVNSAGR